MHAWHAGEEKRSSEDRARADLQCQQLQQQVHALQTQLQGAQGQAAEAHRLRTESCVAADCVLQQACQKLSALEPRLQCKISQAEKVCAEGRCIESCVWCLCGSIGMFSGGLWWVGEKEQLSGLACMLACLLASMLACLLACFLACLLACLLACCPLLPSPALYFKGFFQHCFLHDS